MKRILASTAVLGLAIAGIGTATAAPDFDKVTGGGQLFLADDPVEGPGDTIAFNARNIGDDGLAQGQVQFVDREGAGRPADKFHGSVDCLVVTGNTARFAGTITSGGTGFFRIDVVDNGQGAAAAENDVIALERRAEKPFACDDDSNNNGADKQLARGNVKIHNAAE